jgi:hypothetical protein
MTAVARAQRSSTLHSYSAPFSVVSLPTEPVGCEELTKGGSSAGEELWTRTRGGKVMETREG